MIGLGSVAGATVYWAFLTGIGVLLSAGGLVELRRRGSPVRRAHLAAAALVVLGFAALGYTGVWRSFYGVERTASGLALTYHWPSRRVMIAWDSVARIDPAPGYRGQRPLRIVERGGRQHLSAMIPARDAMRLSRCLADDVVRRRAGGPGVRPPSAERPDRCP